MKRLIALAALLSVLIATGCQPPSVDTTGSGVATSSGGDAIGEAYNLLLQRAVLKVDPAAVAAAGVDGMRGQLLADGVAPPDVQTPAFTADPKQDLQLLQASVQATVSQNSSKMNLNQADDAVIAAMAKSVGDCHTVFFTPQQFKDQQAWIQGQTKFGGIGASLRKEKAGEPVVLWRVFAGSPAQKAGLRDGDVILAVDGKDITPMAVQSVVDLIRGPVGQTVKLTIRPVGEQSTRVVKVVRGEIQPPSVEYRMLPNRIGYVQLYGFPENVAGQMQTALDALDRQGAQALVIDARDNGGGAIDSVTQVLSMFAPKGTLLFYSYDASGQRTQYAANGSVRSHLLPSVVLTNDGTGSGGEVFAAVMREQGVGRIVGTQTAGCVGTGQLFGLSDGSGLQVTVAQLMTGKGKALNQVGVTPDITVDMTVQDLVEGHDPQLDRAVQLIQTGR